MYSSRQSFPMNVARQHPPVILLLGRRSGASDSIDKWLTESRYTAIEAADVFQALEQVSDFTLPARPDVIFLHGDSIDIDLKFVRTLVATSADEPDVPIIDFANEARSLDGETFARAIDGLACRLDEFIPNHSTAKA